MECRFTVGQKIVCIATQYVGYTRVTRRTKTYTFEKLLTLGQVYTVRDLLAPHNPANATRVRLAEIYPPNDKGFPHVCFRPLITVSDFTTVEKEVEYV